ncbi:putative branched-chain-amino-acid transaminase [Dioscorea sansibarensis]
MGRPEENALQMQKGAERMCTVSPSVRQFVHAVKQRVLASKRWVPAYVKEYLCIRPLLLGSGQILGLAPSPEYLFLVFALPIGKYFKYVVEAATGNTFIVKGNIISTPATEGTILPGITRKSIIKIGRDHGYQVVERLVSVDELIDADEVFCTGNTVSVTPVSTITHCGQRLYNTLTATQMGDAEDTRGWRMEIEE